MEVEFGLLGDVEVRLDGRLVDAGHARQRCVLAALLVDANRSVSVNHLVTRVWGDWPPDRARETLYNYVSRLRHALEPIPEVDLRRRTSGYALTVDHLAVDLHRFHDLVAQARAADDEEHALALFDRALGLWRGEALAGLDSPWATMVRSALEEHRFAAELDSTDLQLGRGQHAWLLDEISARAEAHPLDERVAGQMMLALYRSGRQAEALDKFRQLRAQLIEELGIEPGPELQRLLQEILVQAPALNVQVPPATRAVVIEPAFLSKVPTPARARRWW